MARAVLGPLLNDLRGKLGNAVFDNYKGVHIVRSMPSWTSNPQSGNQASTRAALAKFVQSWQGLTLAQKGAWSQVACTFIKGAESDARMNRGGLIQLPRGPFSGYNAFIACNMNRFTSGFSDMDEILEDAPVTRTTPEPLKSFSAVVVGRTITASWEYITPGALSERLEIWLKSVSAGIHPQLIYSEARNANGSTNITTAQGASGILVDLPNGVYQLQAMIVNQYGLTTAPSELVFVQIGFEDMFTYFDTRETILSLNNQAANVAYTEIDLSALIPAGAHTVIIEAEIIDASGVDPSGINLSVRKDVTQGDALRVSSNFTAAIMQAGNLMANQGHVPLQTSRKIEYALTDAYGPPDVGIRLYALGYIS